MTHTLVGPRQESGPVAPVLVRAFDMARDVAPAMELLEVCDAVDHDSDGMTEAEFRDRLTRPHHDPAHDRWVVEEPGRPGTLIATAGIWKSPAASSGFVFGRVHPAWRRRGIGRQLLSRAVSRARELGAAYINADALAGHEPAHAFLETLGFRPAQTFVLMRLLPETPLAAAVYPPGYHVRPYSEINHVPTLTRALNRGFIGHWEYTEETDEEIAHWLTSASVRPEGFFLAYGAHDDVAGVCACTVSEGRAARQGVPTGYIDSLGVDPDHRRRGLGRALLLTGLHWLRDNGQQVIELNAVGDNALALPLYEGVGFSVAKREDGYRLDL